MEYVDETLVITALLCTGVFTIAFIGNAEAQTIDNETREEMVANFNESSLYVEDYEFDFDNETVTITFDSTDSQTHNIVMRNFLFDTSEGPISPEASTYTINGRTTVTFERVQSHNNEMAVLIDNNGEWLILSDSDSTFDFEQEYNWGQILGFMGIAGIFVVGLFGGYMWRYSGAIRNKVSIR